jgi:Domain of unknown function (DUF4410)
MRVIWWAVALACLAGCGSGIGPHQPKVTPVTSVDPAPRTRPSMVYVTDFDLEFPQGSQSQDTSSMRQGPLARLRERLQGGDPVTKAHAAVGMMAASITDDLNEDGVPAQRLSAGDPKPTSGWLVRGVVTELDQGNQLRRAMVGLGAGESELQLWVGVTDLARNPDAPFYTLDASDGSGKMPGAIVKLNPYVAAAKFVMSRHATERDVKSTASAIAKSIASEVKKLQQ